MPFVRTQLFSQILWQRIMCSCLGSHANLQSWFKGPNRIETTSEGGLVGRELNREGSGHTTITMSESTALFHDGLEHKAKYNSVKEEKNG